MDSLIKQTRLRYAGTGQEISKGQSSSSTIDRKIYTPPQTTQPFLEEQRSQSWIRRQFSGQMSTWDNINNNNYDNDHDQFSTADDYPTAIAAAAYAIQSLDEEFSSRSIRPDDHKGKSYVVRTDRRKMKSKEKHTSRILPEPNQTSLKPNYSDETSRRSLKDPDDIKMPILISSTNSTGLRMPEETTDHGHAHESIINRRLSFSDSDHHHQTFSNINNKPPPNNYPAIDQRPDPQRARPINSSLADNKKLNNMIRDNKLDGDDDETIKPYNKFDPDPLTKLPTVETTRRQNNINATNNYKPGPEDSMAAAWEKEEMASINERYEKLRETIDNWEANKKRKARQTLEKKEGDPSEKKREKAFKNYNEDISRIEDIAGGARAQAEENRRKEEYKVKEKANKIRSTGKIPTTCLCF